jgi:hypothetical protein
MNHHTWLCFVLSLILSSSPEQWSRYPYYIHDMKVTPGRHQPLSSGLFFFQLICFKILTNKKHWLPPSIKTKLITPKKWAHLQLWWLWQQRATRFSVADHRLASWQLGEDRTATVLQSLQRPRQAQAINHGWPWEDSWHLKCWEWLWREFAGGGRSCSPFLSQGRQSESTCFTSLKPWVQTPVLLTPPKCIFPLILQCHF